MQVKRQDFGEITEFVNGFSQCSNSILESLVLRSNGWLGGELPYSLGLALKMLKTLELSRNPFWGSIPDCIGNLSSLQKLGLSAMEQLFQKTWENYQLMLVSLDLHDNYQEGVLTETHFQNLTRLTHLDLSVVSTTDSLVLYV